MRYLPFVLFIFIFTACNKCKECEVTSTTSLKQQYSFPVEGVPSTEVENIELCEDQLEAVEGKTILSDSLYNGLEISVSRTYRCN